MEKATVEVDFGKLLREHNRIGWKVRWTHSTTASAFSQMKKTIFIIDVLAFKV